MSTHRAAAEGEFELVISTVSNILLPTYANLLAPETCLYRVLRKMYHSFLQTNCLLVSPLSLAPLTVEDVPTASISGILSPRMANLAFRSRARFVGKVIFTPNFAVVLASLFG